MEEALLCHGRLHGGCLLKHPHTCLCLTLLPPSVAQKRSLIEKKAPLLLCWQEGVGMKAQALKRLPCHFRYGE